MPRGPFQGTWQPGVRPTVVHSPDAVVFINGEANILGCGQCRKRFDFNRYITSVQVDLNVDSAPGSASVSLSVPRHSVDDFFFDGNPLISPMMEVEIFAKGYYLIEGMPQYYPIFWGLVTEVSDSYSGGEHTVSVNCADILKWWELCKININPAYCAPVGGGHSTFGNIFAGSNPYDVIWTLAQQAFGDVVVGSGSLVSLYKENNQKSTFSASLADIMIYWQSRFSKIRSNLLLYGTSGNVVRGDVLYNRYRTAGKNTSGKPKPSHIAAKAVRNANGGKDGGQMVFDPSDPNVVAFRTQFSNAGSMNWWASEYQTKLELANAAKEAIGFEFFMDVTGEIVFKPPFYNLDIISNKPVSWIQDIDIIDWDLSESEAEVFTQIQIQGSFGGNVDYGFGEEATPFTSVTDYHLLRKYGWRTMTYNSEFLGSPMLMFYVGLDMLDRMNAKRFRGTVNIPLRPELRLGFPVYLAPKDQIWYIAGISHNIAFGGRAQTTLTLTAKRSKFIAPKGIGEISLTGYKGETGGIQKVQDGKSGGDIFSRGKKTLTTRQLAKGGQFEVKVGEAAQIPQINSESDAYDPLVLRHPKTGRILGYPNVVMAYTRPFVQPPDEVRDKVSGKGKGRAGGKIHAGVKTLNDPKKRAQALTDQDRRQAEIMEANEESLLKDKHFTNRYTYGLTSAGVYTYLYDNSNTLDEIIFLPAANITVSSQSENFEEIKQSKAMSGMIRPVSDERGFEVVGHYRYGRGVSLRDGSLVFPPEGNRLLRANIGTQIALAGGLVEMLQAQSSGIGTISTIFRNPADAISVLKPDPDLQTGATITPAGEPQFTNVKANFVQTAPLDSPEQAGLPTSVEASQFSRALTLAEMAAKDKFLGGKECSCLLGRPDLNFINVGYQLKVLRGASADNSTQSFGGTTEGFEEGQRIRQAAEEALAAQVGALQTSLNEATTALQERIDLAINRGLTGTVAKLEEEKRQLVDAAVKKAKELAATSDAEVAAALDSEGIDQGTLDEQLQAIEDGKPIAGDALALTPEQVETRVNTFLARLFTTLDDGHQELEAALRGDTVTLRNPDVPADVVRFGPGAGDDNFAPPFGAMGRGFGGDPEALAIQGSTAIDGMANALDEFGANMKAQVRRAELLIEIQGIELEISGLIAEQALNFEDPEATPPGPIQQQINEKLIELANKQQELAILNQEFPP